MATDGRVQAAFGTGAVLSGLFALPLPSEAPDDLLVHVGLAIGCCLLGLLATAWRRGPPASPVPRLPGLEGPSERAPPPPPPAPSSPAGGGANAASGASAAAVEQLRRLVAPEVVAESLARRFVVANKGSPAKAAHMYRGYLKWRADTRVDGIADDPIHPPAIETALREGFSPRLLSGRDLRGRPVMLLPFGTLDVAKMGREGVTVSMIVRRHVRELEKLQRVIDGSADPSAGHLCLIDIKGCSALKFVKGWKLWNALSHLSSKCYPELLGKCVLVRGPKIAGWAVDQSKKFLDPVTASKIELHVGDETLDAALDAHLPPTMDVPGLRPVYS